MEYRLLGKSGFKTPVLSFGTVTFGGKKGGFGGLDVAAAKRLVDICLDEGLNMFDSADIYSGGAAEEVLGQAIRGRRDQVIISTKATFGSGPGPNDVGSSRFHLIRSVEASLRRLGTDYIDLFQLHGFDALTPVEETLSTLNDLVHAGKIRYLGCSNFSGWHLMKSLAAADQHGWERFVAHQAYYSLVGRDYEWELMPLAVDQNVGCVVWSPLGWGRLTGKIRRGQPLPETSRLQTKWVVGYRSAGPRRVPFQGDRRPGSGCARDRQDGAADCTQLAAAAPDGLNGHHRSAPAKSNCGKTWAHSAGSSPPNRSLYWTRPARRLWSTLIGTRLVSRSGIRSRWGKTWVTAAEEAEVNSINR